MHRPNVVIRIVAASADQDRAVHRVTPDRDIVILADGAGGTSKGTDAAEHLIEASLLDLDNPEACVASLQRLDRELASSVSGETTAVLLVVRDGQVYGASVGDSGAFALTTDACFEFTESQIRKPLVGSGRVTPVGFGPFLFNDRILVASDGLLDYVPRSAFKQLALFSPLPEAVDKLISSARLPSGGLQDDISVVLLAPQHQS